MLDARPQAIVHMPHASVWPFLLSAALLVLSFSVLLDIWALAIAAVVASVAALMGWYWPRGQTQET
jgi:O-antigen/teichoic acid export membrane protein